MREGDWVEVTNQFSVLFPSQLSAVIYARKLDENKLELMLVFADGRIEYREIERSALPGKTEW